jgi:hypothetical protein
MIVFVLLEMKPSLIYVLNSVWLLVYGPLFSEPSCQHVHLHNQVCGILLDLLYTSILLDIFEE